MLENKEYSVEWMDGLLNGKNKFKGIWSKTCELKFLLLKFIKHLSFTCIIQKKKIGFKKIYESQCKFNFDIQTLFIYPTSSYIFKNFSKYRRWFTDVFLHLCRHTCSYFLYDLDLFFYIFFVFLSIFFPTIWSYKMHRIDLRHLMSSLCLVDMGVLLGIQFPLFEFNFIKWANNSCFCCKKNFPWNIISDLELHYPSLWFCKYCSFIFCRNLYECWE